MSASRASGPELDCVPETIELSDRRQIAFSEFGAAHGAPVFYFHGFPGSRIEALLGEQGALREGIRLIAVDRPGFGASAFQEARTILDWPADVAELAGHLGIDRFGVLGVSGGAPYAFACARVLPERLSSVAIVSGIAPLDDPRRLEGMIPLNRIGLRLARRAPATTRLAYRWVARGIARNPTRLLDKLAAQASEPDRDALRDRELRRVLAASFREALRTGGRGAAHDLTLLARPWGFRLEDIASPVLLWHGEADRIVPTSMGRHLAERVPQVDAFFLAGEGHFSLVRGRSEEVFGMLARGSRHSMELLARLT